MPCRVQFDWVHHRNSLGNCVRSHPTVPAIIKHFNLRALYAQIPATNKNETKINPYRNFIVDSFKFRLDYFWLLWQGWSRTSELLGVLNLAQTHAQCFAIASIIEEILGSVATTPVEHDALLEAAGVEPPSFVTLTGSRQRRPLVTLCLGEAWEY